MKRTEKKRRFGTTAWAITLAWGMTLLCPLPGFGAGWVLPTGYSDPSNKWTTETMAYDGQTGTYASDGSLTNGWGAPLNLTLTTPIKCGRVRVYADFGYAHVDYVGVDILRDGVWTNVHQGAIADQAWTEITFVAGNVTEARFSFHYTQSNWLFWLYEFQFYEEPPTIRAPTVASDTGSVQETSAVLRGHVIDDGGEPCECRFVYGTSSGSYGLSTPWASRRTAGQAFSVQVTNLVFHPPYVYRAQARNSVGTGEGSEQSFMTAFPQPGSWVSATGHGDASNRWDIETAAHDGDVVTAATSLHVINTPVWGEYLCFDHGSRYCDGVRIYARGPVAAAYYVDQVDIGVLKDGVWTNLYVGTFIDKQWNAKMFARGVVSQARVRFSVNDQNSGFNWELYEFEFRYVNGPPPPGTFIGIK